MEGVLEDHFDIMERSILFDGMTREEIAGVLHCLDPRKLEYAKSDYILRAGQTTDSIGLLLKGSVLVVQEDIWGRRSIVDKVAPSEFFAVPFAASPGSVLNVSVVADDACTVMMLDMNKVLSACSNACVYHVRIVRNLLSALASKTLRLNGKMTHMSKRTTKEKLLSFLSSEALRSGSLSFSISYSRQQLADYLCVDRAAMSVALSDMQKEGLITYHKSEFVLHVEGEDLV